MEKTEHSWKFYLTARDTWEAMFEDCAAATKSIELEQYIMGHDRLGRRFIELFTKKAAEGVEVFVICDKFGSLKLFGSPLVRRLRRKGGHFYFYNPLVGWNILTPWRWFPRTHVKTLLVDSSIAYVGSACMAQHMANWRDTQLRIEGPVVASIRRTFDDIERRMRRQTEPAPLEIPASTDHFRYVINRPNLTHCAVYRELSTAINHASRYLYIATAYFVPHNQFFALLQQAHERNVEIILLVPFHSDVWLADWITLSYVPRLLAAGVRVFRYQGGNLHCKTAIIDDTWGTVGSANFDVLSFFHNREANLITRDPQAIATLKDHFLRDLENSIELTSAEYRQVPYWKRIVGFIARSLKVFF